MVTGICTSSTFATIVVSERTCARTAGTHATHADTKKARESTPLRSTAIKRPPNLAPRRHLYRSTPILSMTMSKNNSAPRYLNKKALHHNYPDINSQSQESTGWHVLIK